VHKFVLFDYASAIAGRKSMHDSDALRLILASFINFQTKIVKPFCCLSLHQTKELTTQKKAH
jgi:hypothetical protein